METQLVACVKDSLDNFLYDNAKFMCERLYAEQSSEVCPPPPPIHHLSPIQSHHVPALTDALKGCLTTLVIRFCQHQL